MHIEKKCEPPEGFFSVGPNDKPSQVEVNFIISFPMELHPAPLATGGALVGEKSWILVSEHRFEEFWHSKGFLAACRDYLDKLC